MQTSLNLIYFMSNSYWIQIAGLMRGKRKNSVNL